jgi:hypothetical protein
VGGETFSAEDRAAVEEELVARLRRETLATNLKDTLHLALVGGGIAGFPVWVLLGFIEGAIGVEAELLLAWGIGAGIMLTYGWFGLRRRQAEAPEYYAQMCDLRLAETFCDETHPGTGRGAELWYRVHRFRSSI